MLATSSIPHPLTLWTARFVVACFLATWLIALKGSRTTDHRDSVWRVVWSAGCVSLAVHILTAMHFEHAWSHTAALEHTAKQTRDVVGIDWGGGVYFNYAILILWTIDVGVLWMRPRPSRFRSKLHPLTEWSVAFMILNATVVFGPAWWFVVAGVFALAGLICRQKARSSRRQEQADKEVSEQGLGGPDKPLM